MIEKLELEQNPLSETVEKIREICPAAVTRDGKIDFEELKTSLATDVAEDTIEKYEFTWVGKNAAKAEANRPIRKTLRPVVADSKDWDNTKNLYIEGDNLDALKLLQESYLGKVKMIYIDPPYNTGNDFVYCDNFKMGCAEFIEKSGQCDADGNRLFANTKTNGRFHSDWCSMMYPRLKIARNLLTDDGVIFISIDDHEQANLKKICDEIFGEDNLVAQLVWEQGRKSMAAQIAINHEYCVIYCKNKQFNINNGCLRDWKVKKQGLEEIYNTYDSLKKQYGNNTDRISKGLKEFYARLP
ncbi:MAG: site-specific DNA-methyltransferase, partial [Alphaproteobacteria bacterium]